VLKFPQSDFSLWLRTDFTDDAGWNCLREAVQLPSDKGFLARFGCLNDAEYRGLTIEDLAASAPLRGNHSCVCIVDQVTLTNPERTILVVD